MAYIRVDQAMPVFDGQPVTFKSPASCTGIEGLKIYYPAGEGTEVTTFALADAHGNNVGGIDLFAPSVLVKVILDTDTGMAYVQNADTNTYLEGRFEELKSELDGLTPEDIGAFGVVGAIASGTDLNDYKEIGAYTATSSVTASLANCPVTSGASQLYVFRTQNSDVAPLIQLFTVTSTSSVDLFVRKHANGSWSVWKILATTDYAVPLDGSKAMTGALSIRPFNNGYGALVKNNSATADYGFQIRDIAADGAKAYLTVRANTEQASIAFQAAAETSMGVYDILHTGNKPSGSYTGNGSATARTINTGGIGNVVEIHSSKGSAIVNAVNGLCYSSGGVAAVASTEAKIVDGVITLTTTNEKLNANGVTYYYQVL